MSQDKPRFIRKNGKVIPVGKKKTGSKDKKPKKRVSKQSVDTLKRRKAGLKRSLDKRVSPGFAATVGGGIGFIAGSRINPAAGFLGGVALGTVAAVKAHGKIQKNVKRLEYVNRSLKEKIKQVSEEDL